MRDIWHKYHSVILQNCLKFHLPNGSWNTYTNFEISLAVFMPNTVSLQIMLLPIHTLKYHDVIFGQSILFSSLLTISVRAWSTLKSCIELRVYVLFINKRFKWLIHIWLVYSICFTKKISETIFPLSRLKHYSLFLFVKMLSISVDESCWNSLVGLSVVSRGVAP